MAADTQNDKEYRPRDKPNKPIFPYWAIGLACLSLLIYTLTIQLELGGRLLAFVFAAPALSGWLCTYIMHSKSLRDYEKHYLEWQIDNLYAWKRGYIRQLTSEPEWYEFMEDEDGEGRADILQKKIYECDILIEQLEEKLAHCH